MAGLTNPYPLLQAINRGGEIDAARRAQKEQAVHGLIAQLGKGLQQRGQVMREDELLRQARAEREAQQAAVMDRWKKEFEQTRDRDAATERYRSAQLFGEQTSRDRSYEMDKAKADREAAEYERQLQLGRELPGALTPTFTPFSPNPFQFQPPKTPMLPDESLKLLRERRELMSDVMPKPVAPMTPYQKAMIDAENSRLGLEGRRLDEQIRSNQAGEDIKRNETKPYRPTSREEWVADQEVEASIRNKYADPKTTLAVKTKIDMLKQEMRSALDFGEEDGAAAIRKELMEVSQAGANGARAEALLNAGWRVNPKTMMWEAPSTGDR